jgi:hypothetical protein
MKANDYLWVGLKLLGTYFLIVGLAEIAHTLHLISRLQFDPQLQGSSVGILRDGTLMGLSTAIVHFFAGIFLICCTGMLVKRLRNPNQDADS